MKRDNNNCRLGPGGVTVATPDLESGPARGEGSIPSPVTMTHTTDQLEDYVLLMLGAVIAINLSEDELNFCVSKPLDILVKSGLTQALKPERLTRMLQDGALSLGRYIVAKKRFKAPYDSLLFTPDEDGFAEMTQADADWSAFMSEVTEYRIALRKSNDKDDSCRTASID